MALNLELLTGGEFYIFSPLLKGWMRGRLEAPLFSPLGQKRLDKRLAISSHFLLKKQ
jgi:hypothetical protein